MDVYSRRAGRRVFALAVFAVLVLGGAWYYDTFRFPPQTAADLDTAVDALRELAPGMRVERGFSGCHPVKLGCGPWFASASVGVAPPLGVRVDAGSVFRDGVRTLPRELGGTTVGAPVEEGVDAVSGYSWMRAPITFPDGSVHEVECGYVDGSAATGSREERQQAWAVRPGLPDGVFCAVKVML